MSFPKGLSLSQAPPFIVVSGFFITACLLWFLGSLLEIYALLTNRLSIPLLTHITTVGFALFTMFGALFQMLPVVAGAVIQKPKQKAFISWLLLLTGYLLLLFGFYLSSFSALLAGASLLFTGIAYTSLLMLNRLMRIKSYTPTSQGIKFALLFVLIGGFSGFLTALSYGGYIDNTEAFLKVHRLFMLFGWIFLLITSVSFQVVEMFFVTRAYPRLYAMNFPYLLTFALIFSLFEFKLSNLPLSMLVFFQALITLHRLFTRKRKIADKSLYFWYLSHIHLLIAVILLVFDGLSHRFLSVYFLFFSTLITGMMLRIIPFLVWFHLSNEGSLKVPLMSEVIDQKLINLCLLLSFALSLSVYLLPIIGLALIPAFMHSALSFLLSYSVIRGSFLYFRLSPLYNPSK